MEEIKVTLAGLHTAVSSTVATPGSLLEGDDIVCRTPGCVESRPGFYDSATSGLTSPDPIKIFRTGNGTNIVTLDLAGTVAVNSGTPLVDEDGVDIECASPVEFQAVDGPGGLYMIDDQGVRRVQVGQAAAYKIGAPAPGVVALTAVAAANGGLTNSSYYAYRAVTLRRGTGSDRREVRSGVSNRSVFLTYNAGPYAVGVRLLLHKGTTRFRAGDFIELYRTLASTTSTPTDDLYLAGVFPITSADVTAGYKDVTDSVADVNLQATALYTNAEEEGMARTHREPPQAGAVAFHGQSLWLGNLRFPGEVVIEGNTEYTTSGTPVRPGWHAIGSCTFAASTTVTTAAAASWMVGMMVFEYTSLSSVANYPVITSVSAGVSFTLSASWTGATGAKNVYLVDTITIDGDKHPLLGPCALEQSVRTGYVKIPPLILGASVNWTYGDGTQNTTTACVEVLTDTATATTAFFAARVFCLDVTEDALTVSATMGSALTPDISSAHTLENEFVPDGVMWSNAREPEHFHLVNVERADPDGGSVLTMKQAGSSLMIFTSKGMVRVTGTADTGVRFDKVDAGVLIVSPDTVISHGPDAYAWTTEGVLKISENGVVPISRNRISEFDAATAKLGAFYTTLAPGAWTASSLEEHLVFFGVPAVSDLDAAASVMAYNTLTNTWTRWFDGDYVYHGAHLGPKYGMGFLVDVAGSTCTRAQKTPALLAASPHTTAGFAMTNAESDTHHAITITVSDEDDPDLSIVTWSGSVTPEAGDSIQGYVDATPDVEVPIALVLSVSGNTMVVDRQMTEANGATVVARLSKAIPCSVTPIAMEAKNPGSLKLWGEGSLWWGSRYGLQRVTLSFRSPHVLATTTNSYTKKLADSRITNESITKAGALRFVVPKNNARSTHLYPTVGIRQSGSRWRLDAVTAKFRYAGGRVQGKFA